MRKSGRQVWDDKDGWNSQSQSKKINKIKYKKQQKNNGKVNNTAKRDREINEEKLDWMKGIKKFLWTEEDCRGLGKMVIWG